MDSKIKNTLEQLQKIHLTTDEKFDMRKDLLKHMEAHTQPTAPRVSPYFSKNHFFASFGKVRAGFAFLLVFCIVGSGIAWASEQALPGDVLYSVKTGVNENVLRVINSTSPVARASFETNIMEKRLVEAETLEKDQKLNQTNESSIQQAIKTQEQRVTAAVVQLAIDDDATTTEVAASSTLSVIAVEPASTTSDAHDTERTPKVGAFTASKIFLKNDTANTSSTTDSSLEATTTDESSKHSYKNNGDDAREAALRVTKLFENHRTIIDKINSDNRDYTKKDANNSGGSGENSSGDNGNSTNGD